MAVPARRTSKTKKRSRRANQKLTTPAIHWDEKAQAYTLSHHVSENGYYNGRKVL
ncbi:50S ribosomal protein L32 [Secundilactobacillus paracollinoides]|uniref:Large ribosomal subunit protein bL32 n=1 Tax=Secundilactobacillus paracollinoides TaxID=240427 RepID=A0A1B2IVS8_9LACO|nr:50S ribosomal protein L32 [Secundilactobacillus paracollinoides]ANZ60348.1 50S ribosomal protein L32 [Secundilactobacillus paracollinoides]ANZ62664.1 50S ribosomal protein L32 [Secundilactobacillus paracollinoides]ANZ66176.1 50S ribosomal protein L32 [Secundilactobacillus paracollinoides]